MLAAIKARFKLPKRTLPAEVADAIDAARIMQRGGDPDDGPRIAVALGGGNLRGMFIFSTDEARRRIIARWPELSKAQVDRAVSYLAARVTLSITPASGSGRKPSVLDFFDRLDRQHQI